MCKIVNLLQKRPILSQNLTISSKIGQLRFLSDRNSEKTHFLLPTKFPRNTFHPQNRINSISSSEIPSESDAGTIMAGVSLFRNYDLERGFLTF